MFDELGFSRMFDVLKAKGFYPQFNSYEDFKSFQATERAKIEADALKYDRENGINSPVDVNNLPF
jgi:hypothetical protein